MHQSKLNQYLTLKDMLALFNVTPMTMRAWRLNKNLPIEYIGQEQKRILFYKPDVIAWARKNKKAMQIKKLKNYEV